MTDPEFYQAFLQSLQVIQELLSFTAGLLTALIVATVWKF